MTASDFSSYETFAAAPPDIARAIVDPLALRTSEPAAGSVIDLRSFTSERGLPARFPNNIGVGASVARRHNADALSVWLLLGGRRIRTIQLMLGHADIKQTQRYLNITDEELRKAMTGVWERRRQLRAVSQ